MRSFAKTVGLYLGVFGLAGQFALADAPKWLNSCKRFLSNDDVKKTLPIEYQGYGNDLFELMTAGNKSFFQSIQRECKDAVSLRAASYLARDACEAMCKGTPVHNLNRTQVDSLCLAYCDKADSVFMAYQYGKAEQERICIGGPSNVSEGASKVAPGR